MGYLWGMETISQWAARTGHRPRTARYWASHGLLPASRVGSVWLVQSNAQPPAESTRGRKRNTDKLKPRAKGRGR